MFVRLSRYSKGKWTVDYNTARSNEPRSSFRCTSATSPLAVCNTTEVVVSAKEISGIGHNYFRGHIHHWQTDSEDVHTVTIWTAEFAHFEFQQLYSNATYVSIRLFAGPSASLLRFGAAILAPTPHARFRNSEESLIVTSAASDYSKEAILLYIRKGISHNKVPSPCITMQNGGAVAGPWNPDWQSTSVEVESEYSQRPRAALACSTSFPILFSIPIFVDVSPSDWMRFPSVSGGRLIRKGTRPHWQPPLTERAKSYHSPIHLGMDSIQLPVLAAVVRRLTHELWVKCLHYSVRIKWTATVDTALNARGSFRVDQVSVGVGYWRSDNLSKIGKKKSVRGEGNMRRPVQGGTQHNKGVQVRTRMEAARLYKNVEEGCGKRKVGTDSERWGMTMTRDDKTGDGSYPGPPPPLMTWPPPGLKETDLPFLLGGLAIALVEQVVLLVGAMIAGARFCLGVGVWTRVWPSRDRQTRPNLRFLLDTGLGIPGDQHACLLAETAARSIAAVLGRVGPPVWCDLERTSSRLVSALGGSTDGFETKAMDVSAASQDATDDDMDWSHWDCVGGHIRTQCDPGLGVRRGWMIGTVIVSPPNHTTCPRKICKESDADASKAALTGYDLDVAVPEPVLSFRYNNDVHIAVSKC
ncbi:hypothetical protein EDB84DRAFT_1672855 [Lactarius hengduanensis]|nr:hypothetical protein EDB84DRAFT_1672855 [Lactarius hengduanensis]